ncbi:MAG TPA: (4Fe-4S)-binding protein [Saprospiraceae bacterium]|nr:(4Fe-4S)-binding protein [Saprospiraceae bacterium]
MSETTKKYTNGEITVVWKPDACIHSRLCWTQLREVFDPRNRPWVNMEGASTEKIIEQVSKCPSGALSYFLNDASNPPEEISSETRIEVIPNGPLLVYGNLTVQLRDGNTENRNKVTAFCRCGQSKNKPFCDGSHIGAGFEDA